MFSLSFLHKKIPTQEWIGMYGYSAGKMLISFREIFLLLLRDKHYRVAMRASGAWHIMQLPTSSAFVKRVFRMHGVIIKHPFCHFIFLLKQPGSARRSLI